MKNVFIVNLASKTGKAQEIWHEIENYLIANKIPYEANITSAPADATEFARLATSSGQPVNLFVMGGDGTINEAINGIADFNNTYFVCLPSGSANDFSKGIGLKGNALDILLDVLNTKDYTSIDLGRITYEGGSRLFAVSSGVGVDAYVCLQALDSKLKKALNKIHMGQMTYGLLTVGDIMGMELADADLIIDGRQEHINQGIFIASMNCPYEGGGIPMVPYASATSGHLSVLLAHDISCLKCFGVLPRLIAGKHGGIKGIDMVDYSTMTIKLNKPMCVHTDGEHVGFLDEMTLECLPAKLKLKGI